MKRKYCRRLHRVEVALLYKSLLIRLPKNLVGKNRDFFLGTGPPKGGYSIRPNSQFFKYWDQRIKKDVDPIPLNAPDDQ